MTSLRVEILRNLEPIVPEWWQLFSRCDDATPFQSPAWLLPWWNCFGQGQPLVITARRDHQLCALAVFYLYAPADSAPAQLFLVGQSVSDYLDILVAPGQPRAQVARELLHSVFDFVQPGQAAHFARLRPTSPVLQAQSTFGSAVSSSQDGVCPQLALAGHTLADFVPRKRTRDNLRNRTRRAQTAGSVQFVTADDYSREPLMHHLLRLHSKRWNSIGLPGMFSDHKMVCFLNQAACALFSVGMLRLHAMLLNDAPIAVSLGMLHLDCAYLYNFGFDPACSVFSPASQVIAFAMEQAAQQGARVFDFLQGAEPYKFDTWGAAPRYTYSLRYHPARRQHPIPRRIA
jgi:CelD/BcsL family acetyltransferase involved in cellulose biosynthesis